MCCQCTVRLRAAALIFCRKWMRHILGWDEIEELGTREHIRQCRFSAIDVVALPTSQFCNANERRAVLPVISAEAGAKSAQSTPVQCRGGKVEAAVSLAQTDLAPLRGRFLERSEEFDCMLHDVVALLAYSAPEVALAPRSRLPTLATARSR